MQYNSQQQYQTNCTSIALESKIMDNIMIIGSQLNQFWKFLNLGSTFFRLKFQDVGNRNILLVVFFMWRTGHFHFKVVTKIMLPKHPSPTWMWPIKWDQNKLLKNNYDYMPQWNLNRIAHMLILYFELSKISIHGLIFLKPKTIVNDISKHFNSRDTQYVCDKRIQNWQN